MSIRLVEFVPNFQPVINAIRLYSMRGKRLFQPTIKAIVTVTVRHPQKRDNASHVLFSSLCPLKFGMESGLYLPPYTQPNI